MKKLAVVLILALVAVCGIFIVGCSVKDEEVLTSYKLDAVLNTEKMTVTASEKVTYVNNYEVPLDSVYFHLYPAAYRKDARFTPVEAKYTPDAYPNGMSYGGIEIKSVTVGGETANYQIGGQDSDILMVKGLTLEPTDSVEINISFELTIPQMNHRFGYSGNIVNLGNWYPVAAIYENSAWRTDPYYSIGDPFYSQCANYQVSLAAPTGWTIAGTGKISTTINGEETITEFSAEKVRDFAIIAGATMNMDEAAVGDVKIRYYYNSDTKAEYHMQLIKDALATFTNLFGEYPYAQLSVVKTNFVQGGMEYPQLVMAANHLEESSYDEAIIHEIAHQWWYATVGNDQINNAWMDEGLTEYTTTIFYEQNPKYEITLENRVADAMKGYVLFSELYAAQITDNSMSRALNDHFSSTDYAYHAYVKSSLMFDSLRHLIGDQNFFEGLTEYYKNHKFKIAAPDDMIGSFETAANIKLKTFFNNWLTGNVELYASIQL